jgi:hypothetical protein
MRILVFDPGYYTGIALWSNGHYRRGFLGGKMDTPGSDAQHLQIEQTVERYHAEDLVVVCESFEYRNGLDRAELISLEYIGVVKLVCQKLHIQYFMQTAAMGKGWTKDHNLERLGWMATPKSTKPNKDMNDAARHLGYFLCHNSYITQDLRTEIIRKGWKA